MDIRRVVKKRVDRKVGGTHVVGDLNAVLAANVGGGKGTTASSTQHTKIVQGRSREGAEMAEEDKGLTEEELEAETGEELPDREAMSLINTNIAAPINAAVALNVASDDSVAYANAEQTAPITQST